MASQKHSLLTEAEAIRERIPFAYWLLYDAVILPLLIWGAIELSAVFVAGILMLSISVVFDITEAIVKWPNRSSRKG